MNINIIINYTSMFKNSNLTENKVIATYYKILNKKSLSIKHIEETCLIDYAKEQLQRSGLFDNDSDYSGRIGKAVLELITVLSNQGHSGFSHSWVQSLFNKLSNYEPICPIENPLVSGKYDDVSNFYGSEVKGKHLQSTEIFSMFSKDFGKSWYCMIEVYDKDENGVSFCTYDRKDITEFPFIYNKKDFEQYNYKENINISYNSIFKINESIEIPLSTGDIFKHGKFKNKSAIYKSHYINSKGDLIIITDTGKEISACKIRFINVNENYKSVFK